MHASGSLHAAVQLRLFATDMQAKERLRIATEKLYQQEVDAEILLEQMKVDMTVQMDEWVQLVAPQK